eukprot:1937147-Prymnesium_polylepis.1
MNVPIGSKTSSTRVRAIQGGWQQYQLFTDNEYVLNTNEVKTMIKVRRMNTIRNSCEYEPYQNGA